MIRASCQCCKWPQDHPLPSSPTVLSVSNVDIFSFYHGEIGKIEVLGKAALCTSFLWCYLCSYLLNIHLTMQTVRSWCANVIIYMRICNTIKKHLSMSTYIYLKAKVSHKKTYEEYSTMTNSTWCQPNKRFETKSQSWQGHRWRHQNRSRNYIRRRNYTRNLSAVLYYLARSIDPTQITPFCLHNTPSISSRAFSLWILQRIQKYLFRNRSKICRWHHMGIHG